MEQNPQPLTYEWDTRRGKVTGSVSDLRQAIDLTKSRSHASDRGDGVSALLAEVVPAVEAEVDLFVSATRRQIAAQGTPAVIGFTQSLP